MTSFDRVVCAAFANLDERAQAELLDMLIHRLFIACRGREGDQLWHVAQHLRTSTTIALKELVEAQERCMERRRIDDPSLVAQQ